MSDDRIGWNDYFMSVAELIATRGTVAAALSDAMREIARSRGALANSQRQVICG